MTSDRASIANVVPRGPGRITQCFDDLLLSSLPQHDEHDGFDLFSDLAAALDVARVSRPMAECHWAEELLRLIAASQRAGWKLITRLPSGEPTCFRRWLGPRLVLWPAAVEHVGLRGIVSSRLTRSLDTCDDWFRALRAAVAETPPEDLLMIVPGTAGVDFVSRAAELSGKRTIRVHCSRQQEPWSQWLLTCLRRAGQPVNLLSPRIYLSAPLNGPPHPCVESEFHQIPQQDRMLVAGCDTLCALRIRSEGNVHRLLRARLAYQQPLIPNIRVAIAPGMRSSVRNELLAAGAVGWAIQPPQPPPGNKPQPAANAPRMLPRLHAWLRVGNYLTHCTRRRNGPWPGQTQREYQDDLIFQRADADHSAFAALRRIVRTKRLVASSDGVRGDAGVVSFTATPLDELPTLRVFRPHRGRWDFEPYGLCVEMGTLSHLGARPVTYVDQISGNTSAEVMFRQKAQTTTRGGGQIDWTVEREWRFAGDLDLSRIPDHAICLFVRTWEEAQQLQPLAPWPVLVLPRGDVSSAAPAGCKRV